MSKPSADSRKGRGNGRRKRGPLVPVGGKSPKARKPQRDTLTLKQLKKAVNEQYHASEAIEFDEDGRPIAYRDEPTRDRALERRRKGVESGDLMALYTALEWCYLDRFGWPVVSPTEPDPEKTIEMPAWLVRAIQKLVFRGLVGKWPKGDGAFSTSAARAHVNQVHLARTFWVLKARSEGLPWEGLFERLSQVAKERYGKDVSPRAFEASYQKVARAYRDGEDLGMFSLSIRFSVPQDWKR